MKKETGDKAAILAVCKYYKGEKECPFTDNYQTIFWNIERQLGEDCFNEDYCSNLLTEAKNYTKSIAQKKHQSALSRRFLKKTLPERALSVHVESLLQKWTPYECDQLLKYY